MNAALERKILEVLLDLHPLLMRERTLVSDVMIATDDRETAGTILLSLKALEGKREVVGVPYEGTKKWKITADGIARLAER